MSGQIEYDKRRRVFYIDVGDMDPKDVIVYLEKVREEYKCRRGKK